MALDERSWEPHELAQLTGVRSSKTSYYREYRHTCASLDRSIRALASTSTALTAIASGAGRLVADFLPAVAETLGADWAALVASHPAFPASPYRLVATRDGVVGSSEHADLGLLGQQAGPLRSGSVAPRTARSWVRPVRWADDGWGWLAVEMPGRGGATDTDGAILATLAHLVVAAVQNSQLLAERERLRAAAPGPTRR
ncbi:MAG: hypothetical protein ACOYBY_02980 [Dermatophilaceae bacterium]